MVDDWYADFVDWGYKPKKTDITCLFRFEPATGMSVAEAAGRIASESSCGTWTTLSVMPKLLPKLKAYAFNVSGNFLKVAYPIDLFESGSITNFLSGPAGNIFGMKAVKSLRLVDVSFPSVYMKNFRGPNYGKEAIKKIFKRKHGPVTSVVPKPKLGFTAKEHACDIGFSVWKGGMDCVKDDENLADQEFNKFFDRVKLLAKYRDKAEKITGDVKDAFINVTARDTREMEKRIRIVRDHGFKYFMIDVVISGFTAVQTAADLAHDYGMAIHGHRAMHSMITRNEKHGMTMLFLAKLARMMGVDNLHIGTVIGKLEGDKREIVATKDMITSKSVGEIRSLRLEQDWGSIKPVLPVSSGGLHPGLLPQIFDIYGTTDIAIQAGGGTQGHPMGAEAGAKAIMQAIEAYHEKVPLQEYAKTHRELKAALDKWGFERPV
ncbi:MAG: type III ribulose-bisphosphate carboxylase [Candidatus Aenigmarchaeota archaeon]|nr:type III ribulose-bisphosphate carboxylase [Candidatus Aenigmarchaeota archaeon]